MSEVQSRGQSSRGRGSFRGGRGGYRGTRGGAKAHGRSEEQDTTTSLEEQGELGELKIKYGDKLPLMREVCQGWSDEDLIYALQDADGDTETALDKITTGKLHLIPSTHWPSLTLSVRRTITMGRSKEERNKGKGHHCFIRLEYSWSRSGLFGRSRSRTWCRTWWPRWSWWPCCVSNKRYQVN